MGLKGSGVSHCPIPNWSGLAQKQNRRGRMAELNQRSKTGRGKRGPVAGTPEARRGGEAVRDKYGSGFYSKIGKKGGDTVKKEHGPEFYSEIGKKGGESTKARQDPDFYARIGKKGGAAKKEPRKRASSRESQQ